MPNLKILLTEQFKSEYPEISRIVRGGKGAKIRAWNISQWLKRTEKDVQSTKLTCSAVSTGAERKRDGKPQTVSESQKIGASLG